jgi:hypothetical protein
MVTLKKFLDLMQRYPERSRSIMIHQGNIVTRFWSILNGWELTNQNKKFMREKVAYEER